MTANMPRSLLGIFCGRWRIPVGLKESYLLLLPITPQSLALSTCKMTLGMPVLMVFYRLRLCFSEMRPTGARCSHLPALLNSSADGVRWSIRGRKSYSRVREAERGGHVCPRLVSMEIFGRCEWGYSSIRALRP